MPRFVILHHVTPRGYRDSPHYDLMLEDEGKLLTWSLPELPQVGMQMTATKLPDHRLVYLEYEGPIAGDRGEVKRVDEGEFTWIKNEGASATVILQGRSTTLTMELRKGPDDRWIADIRSSGDLP
jgi:hypothetical protein